LNAILGESVVTVTPVIAELNPDNSPVEPRVTRIYTTAIPVSITPVFIE